MSVIKKIFTAVTSTAAVAAVLSLAPTAAHADPWPADCAIGYGYYPPTRYTTAICYAGGGYVQAIAKCSQTLTGAPTKTAYGPWRDIGVRSDAYCPASYVAVGYAINKKPY